MENKTQISPIINNQINKLLNSSQDKTKILKSICTILKNNINYYNWVGFYLADNKNKQLNLTVFDGELTEHACIEFGRGICGQVAETKKIFLVQDVSEETNYLSCSSKVKSEIVIPIIHEGVFLGELDIDSHFLNPFTQEDEIFLSGLCEKLANFLIED